MSGERKRAARKAAIALLSLPEDVAAELLARLGPEEVRRLRQEMQALGEISDEQAAEALAELADSVATPLALARSAGPAYLLRLAQRAFGEARAEELLAEPSPPEPAPLEQLRGARVTDLAQLLSYENEQVAAMVLTQLAPELAARVLAEMPAELAAEVVARLASAVEVPADAVAAASQSLVRSLEATGGLPGAEGRASFDGLAFSAQVVRELGAQHGGTILEQIAKRDRTAATKVRAALLALESPSVKHEGGLHEGAARAAQRGAS